MAVGLGLGLGLGVGDGLPVDSVRSCVGKLENSPLRVIVQEYLAITVLIVTRGRLLSRDIAV